MNVRGGMVLKRAPFVRILPALMAGILIQWYGQAHPLVWIILLIAFTFIACCFFFIPFFRRYKYSIPGGVAILIIFLSLGALLCHHHDIRKNKNWFGKNYNDTVVCLAMIEEPPVKKIRSYKAIASIDGGKIIIYSDTLPGYGSRIAFRKTLQPIRNAGNPGGFDYSRYALFKGITHQVYLKRSEYVILTSQNGSLLKNTIYKARSGVLDILRTNIPGKKELGLAEALLIGYKDDLDPELVQTYSNTGVVHIIAISGMHLGLIYWILLVLVKPFKRFRWLRTVVIIAGLWAFSLLAGAQPSVLRSALMFSFIALGENFGRKNSVFNSLAASAFLLLCMNPFLLWDAGFQLSYAAVLSIVLFMRPIYNWFYIKNKLLDFCWKLNAVTIAAQVLTIPLTIYHFHQFPTLFLLSNFLAVPLSSIIVLGEIFLCTVSFLPSLALLAGKLISFLTLVMNKYVEQIETFPASRWGGLQITFLQSILLFIFIAGFSYWLIERSRQSLQWAVLSITGFLLLRSISFIQCSRQEKIIIYNIPRRKAIDLIEGRKYLFVGDSSLNTDKAAQNFCFIPSRTLYRVKEERRFPGLFKQDVFIHFNGKHIVCLDKPVSTESTFNPTAIDLLVLSSRTDISIKKYYESHLLRQVVIDATVQPRKSDRIKKECDSLHIPCHDVATQGAFVMNWR